MHAEDTPQCVPHARVVINNTDGLSLIGHSLRLQRCIEPNPRRSGRKNASSMTRDIIQTAGIDLLSAANHLLFGAALRNLRVLVPSNAKPVRPLSKLALNEFNLLDLNGDPGKDIAGIGQLQITVVPTVLQTVEPRTAGADCRD